MEMTEQQKDALRRNTFSHYNFFELEQASLDYAVYKLEIRPESRNSPVHRLAVSPCPSGRRGR